MQLSLWGYFFHIHKYASDGGWYNIQTFQFVVYICSSIVVKLSIYAVEEYNAC